MGRATRIVAAVLFGLAGVTGETISANAQGGFFGSWFYRDGSQAFNAKAVAGAAPNALANAAGARCEYRYIVQNGQRIRYEFCQ